jgi:hypothetical protein
MISPLGLEFQWRWTAIQTIAMVTKNSPQNHNMVPSALRSILKNVFIENSSKHGDEHRVDDEYADDNDH